MTAEPADAPEDTGFRGDLSLRIRRLKGQLFEGSLVGATLVGIIALAVLFLFITVDALGVSAASPSWYLLYFGTLVAPTGLYTLYVRRRPDAAAVNARAFAVVFGSLALALSGYIVVDALGPADVAVFTLAATVPPALVLGYTRVSGETHLTGPAIPVSILGGVAVGALLYDPLVGVLGGVPDWLLFVLLTTLPIAAGTGVVLTRRTTRRIGLLGSGAVVASGPAVATLSVAAGLNPSFAVVVTAGVFVPTALLAADTFQNRPSGRVGLLGPVVVAAGILAGAVVESQYGVVGLDSWLTPTLLLESWSTFRPEEAGIYPQLVGSILIVGVMALLSFPVGIGAAIYLEEYAPSTGWQGRLATILDVNISNLAGVPSVVYGLLGLALFRQVFGLQPGIVVAGGATLGLLILPIVIVSSQEALRSVPDELRRGSYGLGASRWQTVRNVVLPEAVPGILTGTILALGRAIGETAPLVMIGVATTRFEAPSGLFSGATALPLQIFAAKANSIPEYRTGVVAATALVLLGLMLLMNATAILIRKQYQGDT